MSLVHNQNYEGRVYFIERFTFEWDAVVREDKRRPIADFKSDRNDDRAVVLMGIVCGA